MSGGGRHRGSGAGGSWRSSLAVGRVRHHRFVPSAHGFSYRVGLWCLDLAEADALLDRGWWSGWRRPGLLRFHRPDFLPGADDLATAVRDLVEARGGFRPAGRIELLTALRAWGVGFNPVSFYLCRDGRDQVEAIVAEITNTPWRERHAYVLTTRPVADPDPATGAVTARPGSTPWEQDFAFAKRFHVSPFQPMDHEYRWAFRFHPTGVVIGMRNLAAGRLAFTADLVVGLRPATPARVFRHLLAWPGQCVGSLWAIYWQALRLWAGRVPFFDHPHARGERHAADLPGSRPGSPGPSSAASAPSPAHVPATPA